MILHLATAFVLVGAIASADIITDDQSKGLFSHPFGGMSGEHKERFVLGKSFFTVPWVEAPSATSARDGLGPLFSANTCISCHPRNGAGSVYTPQGSISRSLVTRLSLKGETDPKSGFLPDPIYGAQLSINGVKGVRYEGKPTLVYETVMSEYADGSRVELRRPIIGVSDLGYGPLHPQSVIAHRIAPALVGLGLLDRISDAEILSREDPDDRDGDGISGRANRVFDPSSGKRVIGKFTWKASAGSVRHQVAAAFHHDMGLSTSLFPHKNCTESQKECLSAPKGREPLDVTDERLDAVSFYVSHLRVPRPQGGEKGKALFRAIGCASCHTPSLTTADGTLIEPYSDLLLHDMGADLSDGRREFDASEREWRTAPLWGIGKRTKVLNQRNYLHDGRARSLEEAILWHGGEASGSKERFRSLSAQERRHLLDFLEGL
jgi:CxxC motif-containing protein (DUF1111 family)